MQKGTTPTHTFTLPFDASSMAKVRVIYSQNDRRILVKDNCTVSGATVTVQLSQADTYLFDHKKPVEIQLRLLTHGGGVMNSEIYKITADRCLDTEVFR
jgi:hypothetical protein